MKIGNLSSNTTTHIATHAQQKLQKENKTRKQDKIMTCHTGTDGTTGLLNLLFEILEQNMNISSTNDKRKSLKYVLISCIPKSSTSIFFPYLLLRSIKYPSRYSSIDSHELGRESFKWISSRYRGPCLKIVKNAADQSLRTLWKWIQTEFKATPTFIHYQSTRECELNPCVLFDFVLTAIVKQILELDLHCKC